MAQELNFIERDTDYVNPYSEKYAKVGNSLSAVQCVSLDNIMLCSVMSVVSNKNDNF
jgi:hypothetical protein